ncbi:lmo0937 family membrane protein [Thiobacillus sp. 65-1402]|uniref:lmo0937 family membrane protein n=1 Tax=Thiobacillus sp. 65-1402 TaxID=1895861 RepID=UPI0025F3FD7E|nr:lmo0937 family membrane protein [Thiobacillus sp. 65-1402]
MQWLLLLLGPRPNDFKEAPSMLETIAVVLIVLWLLGLVSSYTLGGFIHILLLIAIVAVLLRVVRR